MVVPAQHGSPCPTEEDLQLYLLGQLGPMDQPRCSAIQVHLKICPDCFSLLDLLLEGASVDKTALASAQPVDRKKNFGPPDHFEEYRFLRRLGQGAMGVVCAYHDTLLDRLVAIKFTLLIDQETKERFLTEGRAIARLSHPNVVAVYRVGQYEDRPYLVSEFIRGQSLDQLPKPLPPADVQRIGIGLCQGLAAAHRHGVLHRDIKPANVMLTEEGRPKLLDFGLARLADRPLEEEAAHLLPEQVLLGSPQLTPAGSLVGTPLYIAPELWQGAEASRRSDLYALGALLYQLATGRPPYLGRSAKEVRHLVLSGDAPPPRSLVQTLPEALSLAIERAMSRDPSLRPSCCEEFAELLQGTQVLQTSPELAGNVPLEGNPYRGLEPFQAEHRAIFFGRSAEVREVVGRLRSEALLVLAGDSGVGKSSLCRAGVLPPIEEGALEDGLSWVVRSMVPGRHPLRALADALAPVVSMPETTLAQLLRDRPEDLERELRRVQGPNKGVLLLIDQMEELITQSINEELSIVSTWLGRVQDGNRRLRVILTARSDFLTRLAALPGVGRQLERSLFLVRPLSEEGLREAIVAPAARKGFSFETDGMVEELIRTTEEAQGGLPLLQFALFELWRSRDEVGHRIPESALHTIGGVAGALARHADDLLNRLTSAEQEAARRLLLRLVTADGTRHLRTRNELIADGDERGRRALEELVKGRLLVGQGAEDPESGGAYQIAHEALLSGWGTLRTWLSDQEEERLVRQRLDQAAMEWARLGQPADILWGTRQVEEAASLDQDYLSRQETSFLQASRRAIRKQRWLRIGVVVSVPILAGGVYAGTRMRAVRERREAVAARIRESHANLGTARAARDRLASLRTMAFGRYDSADQTEGDRLWQQVLSSFSEVEGFYRSAGRAAEAAMVLDGGGLTTRRLLGGMLFEHAQLLDWDSRRAEQEDLVARMGTFDPDLKKRFLAPGRLSLQTDPPNAEVLLQIYHDQGSRKVLGASRSLGFTPISQRDLIPGSYLVTLRLDGYVETRYPVLLARGESLSLHISLPRTSQVPQGMLYVPAGRFLFGAEDEVLRSLYFPVPPMHEIRTGGYLIGRTEVTFEEWIRYLRTLPPNERNHQKVANTTQQRLELLQLPDGRFQLTIQPTAEQLHKVVEGQMVKYQERHQRKEQNWLRFPATGMTHGESLGYLRWLDATGQVPGARLCTEHEWERAARGADGRSFPPGKRLRPDDADFDETYGRNPHSFGPDEVGSHPSGESPHGVADMAGNAWEWVASVTAAKELIFRGGGWYHAQPSARSINRSPGDPTLRDVDLGLRVCTSWH